MVANAAGFDRVFRSFAPGFLLESRLPAVDLHAVPLTP